MNLYSEFQKIDTEQRQVWGYASTEDLDTQGDIVSQDALKAAWTDYWGNVREMHQPSAVGVVREHSWDDKGLYIGVYVADDQAWEKVRSGVYKGFSIGGSVISRDTADRRKITGLTLREISLVDRGANEAAKFEIFKFDRAGKTEEPVEKNQITLSVDVEELDAKLQAAQEFVAKLSILDEKLEAIEKAVAAADAHLQKVEEPAEGAEEISKLEEVKNAAQVFQDNVLEKLSQQSSALTELIERLEKVEQQDAGVQPATGAEPGLVSKTDNELTATDLIKALHRAQ